MRRSGERGMVLLVALVVLVAIMVAGVAMMRSVDTATLVAGNLAFQQSATNAADKGVEAAIAMMQKKASGAGGSNLNTNDPSSGYQATLQSTDSPDVPSKQSWQDFWDNNLASWAYDDGIDQFGNHIWYVVHRECANAAPPGAGGSCVESPAISSGAGGNDNEAGGLHLQSATQVYYRITVRVQGPKRTESYVQSHVAM